MNITAVLDKLRIAYVAEGEHHHTRNGWIQIDCPWCSPRSGRYRLGISLTGGYGSCWTCGGKRLPSVLMEASRLSFPEVKELLDGVGWKAGAAHEKIRAKQALKVPRGIVDLLPAHRRYLKRRGFDPDAIARLWGVRGLGQTARLSWRLWLPITSGGEVVSWTTRAISDRTDLRYITASEDEESVTTKSLLYGEDFCRHAVVVCEGPLDAWAIGPGAVATLGTVYTQAQMLRVKEYPVRVICFDQESDAQRRANKLATDLQVFPGETHLIQLESGKDAAEADREEIDELRNAFLR